MAETKIGIHDFFQNAAQKGGSFFNIHGDFRVSPALHEEANLRTRLSFLEYHILPHDFGMAVTPCVDQKGMKGSVLTFGAYFTHTSMPILKEYKGTKFMLFNNDSPDSMSVNVLFIGESEHSRVMGIVSGVQPKYRGKIEESVHMGAKGYWNTDQLITVLN